MPITLHAIQIKVPTPVFNSILQFGRDHDLVVCATDRVMPATVVSHIVRHTLKLHNSPPVQEHRETEGGTTLDLVSRAVHRYLSA